MRYLFVLLLVVLVGCGHTESKKINPSDYNDLSGIVNAFANKGERTFICEVYHASVTYPKIIVADRVYFSGDYLILSTEDFCVTIKQELISHYWVERKDTETLLDIYIR